MAYRTAEKILGVEITRTGIYGVVLHLHGKRTKVLHTSQTGYSEGFSVEGVSHALETLISHPEVMACRTAAVIFSAALLSFRVLDFPFKSETKIRQVLDFELASHLPLAHEAYTTDFVVLDHLAHAATDSQAIPVLTASIPTDLLDTCYTQLKENGLTPKVITAGGLLQGQLFLNERSRTSLVNETSPDVKQTKQSLFNPQKANRFKGFEIFKKRRALKKNHRQATPIILMERHDKAINAILLYKGHVSGIRSFHDRFALPLSINGEDKHKTKKLHSNDDIPLDIKPILTQTVTSFALRHDIDMTVDQWNVQWDPLPRQNDQTMRSLKGGDLSVQWNDEGEDFSVQWGDKKWHNAVSVASLSPRTKPLIDFCNQKYQDGSIFKRYQRQMVVLSFFMLLSFFSFFFNIRHETMLIKQAISKLDRQLIGQFQQTFPEIKVIVDPLMQMQVKVKEAQKERGFGGSGKGGAGAVTPPVMDVLYALSEKIPRQINVTLHRLIYNDERVVISGTTDNFNSVDQIKNSLERTPMFKKVTISNAAADKNGSGVKFSYSITFY